MVKKYKFSQRSTAKHRKAPESTAKHRKAQESKAPSTITSSHSCQAVRLTNANCETSLSNFPLQLYLFSGYLFPCKTARSFVSKPQYHFYIISLGIYQLIQHNLFNIFVIFCLLFIHIIIYKKLCRKTEKKKNFYFMRTLNRYKCQQK